MHETTIRYAYWQSQAADKVIFQISQENFDLEGAKTIYANPLKFIIKIFEIDDG